MSPSLFRAAAAVLLAASACSTETGVLIEVTRDDSVPADVARLEFYVGIDKIDGHPSSFVDFDSEDGAQVDGRDLASDPYRLMLRVGDYPDNNIMVAVLALRGGDVVGFGALDSAVPFVDGKVTMWSVVLSAELPDGFAVTDEGCLRFVDAEGNYVSIGRPGDLDCDGYLDGEGDCNDLDPGINSGAGETCENGVDEDCDGEVDENVDDDGDQVTTCDGDCNDGDPLINPNADDPCDGVDNNCNGECDDGHDADGDEFTVCGSRQFDDGSCYIDESKVDCDDQDGATYPGAAEICDGADNDCDGACEEDSSLDRDGDLYTACGSVIGVCGRSEHYVDCDDEEDSVHPGAAELCNGVDDDCDGAYLEIAPCFARDGEGTACSLGERACVESDGSGSWAGDCSYDSGELSQVPLEACTAYENCEASGEDDPFHCAVSAGEDRSCDVNFQVSTGLQCPDRQVALPTDGSSTCSWSIVGGTTDFGDYLVGLLAADTPDGTPVVSLDVCAALIRVTSVTETSPAAPAVVILRRSDADGEDYIALDLESVPNGSCSPPAGLVCSSSDN
jgi:hypothetical protein